MIKDKKKLDYQITMVELLKKLKGISFGKCELTIQNNTIISAKIIKTLDKPQKYMIK